MVLESLPTTSMYNNKKIEKCVSSYLRNQFSRIETPYIVLLSNSNKMALAILGYTSMAATSNLNNRVPAVGLRFSTAHL